MCNLVTCKEKCTHTRCIQFFNAFCVKWLPGLRPSVTHKRQLCVCACEQAGEWAGVPYTWNSQIELVSSIHILEENLRRKKKKNILSATHMIHVTHCDKRFTKLLGRSRDNLRKQHIGGNFFCRASVLSYSYCTQPILTYNWHTFQLKHNWNTFQMTQAYFNQSISFQLHFSKWPLYFHLLHNFTLVFCTVFETDVKWKLFDCAFCWCQ